jgi:hypothetical protein
VEVKLHAILTSSIDGGKYSDSRSGRFIAAGRLSDGYWLVTECTSEPPCVGGEYRRAV